MAFDGAFLHMVCAEIGKEALLSRVDKVYQPMKDQIVLTMRCNGKNRKLLFSADASHPRIHFSEQDFDNPASPPMFCMLLRKHITNAKLIGIEQMGLERVVAFLFETRNEFGDVIVVRLIIEIMGRHSNIILVNEHGKVVDAVKRVDDSLSSRRRVLPGVTYEPAPTQNKHSILTTDMDVLLEKILDNGTMPLSKALLQTLEGVSPLLCREISYRVAKNVDPPVCDMNGEAKDKLRFHLNRFRDSLEQDPQPILLQELSKKPLEYYFSDIQQYQAAAVVTPFSTLSAVLDAFYKQKDHSARLNQKAHDLLRFLVNATEKISRKLDAQRQELQDCSNRETLRVYGDILNANLYRLQKGDTVVDLENFYEEGSPTVRIKLDPMLTPSQNAQHYYKEYKKADTAEKKLQELIGQGEVDLAYLDSVFDALSRASTEVEVTAIRMELTENRFLKPHKGIAPKKFQKLSYLRYCSSDGYTILCGRNNLQNDKLTLKEAHNYDLWFHVQKMAGSHVVILSQGEDEFPDRTVEEAAMIAAYNSKARQSSKVAVDYTLIKHVKKPAGAKPGLVVYEPYYTILVNPDADAVAALAQKD